MNKITKSVIALFKGFFIGFFGTIGGAVALIIVLYYLFDLMWLLDVFILDKYKYIVISFQIAIFIIVTVAYLRKSMRTSFQTSFRSIFIAILKTLLANLIFYLALYFIISVFYLNPLLIFIPPSVYLGYRFLKNNNN